MLQVACTSYESFVHAFFQILKVQLDFTAKDVMCHCKAVNNAAVVEQVHRAGLLLETSDHS